MDSDPRHRLFVAAPLPPELEQDLLPFLDRIATVTGVRPTIPSNLHLTAFFIGPVHAEFTPLLLSGLERLSGEMQAFTLSVRAFEFRGKSSHPSMIWLAFQPSDEFQELHDLLRRTFEPFQETKSAITQPQPHITLARIRGGHDIRPEVVFPNVLPADLTIDRIGLWRTHSTPGGVRYERLNECLLNR